MCCHSCPMNSTSKKAHAGLRKTLKTFKVLNMFRTSRLTANWRLFTQRRSVVKSVGCFQRRLFVCVFVCQDDNFRKSKHRMMKLGGRGRCIVQKCRPSSNLRVIATWVRSPQKCGVGLRRWENQCRLSSLSSVKLSRVG